MLAKTHIIKIGNSQGFRIPKLLLAQAGLSGEVEIEAQSGQLIIRPPQSSRDHWDSQFEAMSKAGDDRLLDGDALLLTEWETDEWKW